MAKDGEFGKCDDFLFEDRPSIFRYMVADTALEMICKNINKAEADQRKEVVSHL